MARGRKKGNHDPRRAEIAEVACTVFLRLGLERTTLADIARELGKTTGILRHYFANKYELLFYTKNLVFNRSFSRATEAASSADGLQALRAWAMEVMPVTPASIDRYKLLAMFDGSAIGNARRMRLQESRNDLHSRHLAALILKLQKERIFPKGLDPRIEAAGILALIDGMGDQAIVRSKPWPRAQMIKLLDRYIDSLCR